MNVPAPSSENERIWSRAFNACGRAFHAYAGWLVSISWKRFIVLSLLLIISMAILAEIPPLSWTYSEIAIDNARQSARKSQRTKESKSDRTRKGASEGVDISIDEDGIRITAKRAPAVPVPAAPTIPTAPATPAAPAAPAAPATPAAPEATPNSQGVTIELRAGSDAHDIKDALKEFREALLEAYGEAIPEAEEAAKAAARALRPRVITRTYGDPLVPLALWFILFSIITKVAYKGKVQAEAKAEQATEVAESEALKRQVVEARMAAMQAQVEPHFLFNTLASIDHLIETDPQRASKMQKNLIALLRASMPTMREANAMGSRDLGRELELIRPYLEILKVRMEDRLQTEIRVSDGLLSAEFPPMMLQSLVENAIKHGLEPKAEGGLLRVSADIVHGKLAVTVADTGLGFGMTATAGTGIGLRNIRERLKLLYGSKASLSVTELDGGGTSVTITLPYVARPQAESPG